MRECGKRLKKEENVTENGEEDKMTEEQKKEMVEDRVCESEWMVVSSDPEVDL